MKKKILTLALIALGFNSYSQVNNGLIAEYPFTSGNANDVIGNHYGNVFGATPTTDRFGNDSAAFYFNHDSSQYIEVSYSPDFTPATTPFSISVWFLSVAVDTADEYIIDWYRCGANPTCTQLDAGAYAIGLLDTSRLYYDVRDDNLIDSAFTTPQQFSDNNWHHAVLVIDPISDFVKCYLDNSLLVSLPMNISAISDGGVQIPLEFGRVYRTGWGSPSSYFNGKIDDIRFYNRALSSLEIDSLYNGGTVNGISSAATDFNVTVFPNPSNDVLNINSNQHLSSIQLYDLSGRLLLSKIISENTNSIELKKFSSGTYLLQIDSKSSGRIVKRIIRY